MSPERRYAEEAGVLMAGLGLPPAAGKLFGWLMICEPAAQTSGQLVEQLGLSKGSVSTNMRLLENVGMVRRVPAPGRRGHAYQVAPDTMMRVAADPTQFRRFRELMDRGVTLAGGEDASRADRLRVTRDFYAFLERELPKLVARFRSEYPSKGENDD
ncbi:GbsR/MarR family transcriptional regulator [Micromonospora zhanjiangensis]|uniref:GbsR/MarR family transcriptional regulator n=1 Tax=Micromonospora zhanjiangensis TaxID=1522057 RepID=A0ABV8KHX4_9ACTN